MKKVNRGKQFEEEIKKAFERVSDIERLIDPMSGMAAVGNIADFIVYRYPYMAWLEAKATYDPRLSYGDLNSKKPHGMLTKNQIRGLSEKSKIPGVFAGVVVWFIEHDYTCIVPFEELEKHFEMTGMKSVNVNDLKSQLVKNIELEGTKRQVLYTYDATSAMRNIELWLKNDVPIGQGVLYEPRN